MTFGPISRNTLPDTIIERFREAIAKGQFKPGDRVPPERELAEVFGVGRTSIREAMKALTVVGLVRRTREGTYVGGGEFAGPGGSQAWKLAIQRANLEELFETRLMFECNLVELAARRADEDDLQEMRAALEGVDGTLDGTLSSDMAFHSAIAAAAHNTAIFELYTAVKDLLFRSHDVLRSAHKGGHAERVREALAQTVQDHRSLFASIEQGNPSGARWAMQQHLDRTRQVLSELAGLVADSEAKRS